MILSEVDSVDSVYGVAVPPQIEAMAQEMITAPFTPCSEYIVKCASDFSITIRKSEGYSVIIQKARNKVVLSLEEWKAFLAHAETVELAYLLLNGNIGRA